MPDEQSDPAPSTSNDAPAASVATKPKPAPPALDRLPPFRVLLHNDDVNTFEWVIHSLVAVAFMPPERAWTTAEEAHTKGLSLVTVTHKERAELIVEQLRSKGLISTMEPAE